MVEDDESLAEAMKYSLHREGYDCSTASDGRQGLSKFRSDPPSLVLLDLMMPGISGLDLCRLIRAESIVPIVVVTARGSEPDKIASLEMGADDYITKPFSVRELIARVRSQLRRMAMIEQHEQPSVLKVGVIAMDVVSHITEVRGESIALTPKEFALLRMLLESPGRLMAREILISGVWGDDYVGDTRTLDVHIKRLRAKIEEDPAHPELLSTVRGLGYKFEPA